MAKIVLEIQADASQANSELQKMATGFTEINKDAKTLTTQTTKGFKDVEKAAKDANKELANPAPTEAQKKQISAMQQLKNEIKAYESAAIKAGEGTAEFARNIALAGSKKADLKDLKQSIDALDPDTVAKGFLGLGTSIAGGFAVAQGAIALAGGESKELEKALLKVQAAQAILSGLQELANAKDEIGKVRLIILNKLQTREMAIQAVAMETQIALTGAQSVEVVALAEAQAVQTAATGKLTIVQRLLNIAMKANPVGIIIAAIAAIGSLAAVIIYKQEKTKESIRIERENSKALDGTIIKSKELREEYDKAILSLQSVQREYDVYNGKLTEAQATLETLASEHKLNISNLEKDLSSGLQEINSGWTNFQNKLTGSEENGREERLALQKDFETKAEIEDSNYKAKVLAAELEAKKKLDDIAAAAAKELADKNKEAYEKLLSAQSDYNQATLDLAKKVRQGEIEAATGTEKVQLQEAESLRELEILKNTLIQKRILAGKGNELSIKQLEQFAILEKQIILKSAEEQLTIDAELFAKLAEQETANNEQKKQAVDKDFADQLKFLTDHNKARELATKEGSAERLKAEIDSIRSESNARAQQLGLSTDEIFIITEEARQKIIDLQKELDKKGGFSWEKLLGVSTEDLAKIKSSIGSILNSAKTIVDQQLQIEQDGLDKRKAINDEILSNSDNRLKTLQEQLNTELQLNEQGFASNVKAVQDAIALEMAAKQQALDQEKQIVEEQAQLKKKQAIADSISQVSSLLTAGASIFAKGALTWPVGTIAAIASIAGMIATFISLKAKLSAAGFKEGGYTGDKGESEVAGSVHGREFVSTAKTTKKHRGILEALHTENYSGLKMADMQPLLEGVKFNTDTLSHIEREGNNYQQNKSTHAQQSLAVMKATNRNLTKFFEHVKNKPTESRNQNGDIIIKKGNSTQIIKRK